MALTRREQYILILALGAITLLIANSYILSPILASRSATSQRKEQVVAELEKAQSTLRRRTILTAKWEQMQQAGLTTDIDKTETSILKFVNETAKNRNINLTAQQPERRSVQQGEDIGEIEFTLAGTGDIESITNFLWDIETAEVPVKLKNLSIGSSDDSGSTMNLTLTISSIYIVKQEQKTGAMI